REDAAQLRGSTVQVPRSAFPALPDDEYYWVDLIGCLVYGVSEPNAGVLDINSDIIDQVPSTSDERPVLLGRVVLVTDNGAHGVLHVQRLDGDGEPILSPKGKPLETLVPFVNAHVHSV